MHINNFNRQTGVNSFHAQSKLLFQFYTQGSTIAEFIRQHRAHELRHKQIYIVGGIDSPGFIWLFWNLENVLIIQTCQTSWKNGTDQIQDNSFIT